MKTTFTKIIFSLIFLVIMDYSIAQSPKAFNYQAVARDNSGNVMQNHAVSILIMLHIGSAMGSVVYQEQFLITTNHFGLFTLAIGTGTNIFGSFDTIAWHKNQYWLQVAMDPDAGSSFSDMGTSQLLSVPYAMYAENTGALPGGTPGQTIRHDNTAWVADTNLYNDGSRVGIGTTNPTSQLQLFSNTGKLALSVSGGSSADYPLVFQEGGTDMAKISFPGNQSWGRNIAFSLVNPTDHMLYERMRIDSNGYIGIGTTSPQAQLDVADSIDAMIRVSNFGSSFSYFDQNDAGGILDLNDSTGVSKTRIRSIGDSYFNGGNVGIGTTNPTTGLDIKSTGGLHIWNNCSNNFTDGFVIQTALDYLNATSGGMTQIKFGACDYWGTVNSYGYIAVCGDGVQAEGQNKMYFSVNDNFSKTNGVVSGAQITLQENGSVGIGTNNPGKRYGAILDVNGNIAIGDANVDNSTAFIGSNANGGAVQFAGSANGSSWRGLHLGQIDNGGNFTPVLTVPGWGFPGSLGVGIGTTNPTATLSVNGTANKTGGGSWDVFSDKRLKTNITPFFDGISIINQINPVCYNYNGKGGIKTTERFVGIIAQDMQKVAPYTVKTVKMKLNENDAEETDILSFDPSSLDFILINAVKEQHKMIDSLKKENTKIAVLETKIENLQSENASIKEDISSLKMSIGKLRSENESAILEEKK